MIHEMYGFQCMILKGRNIILVSVIIYSIADNLLDTSTLREKKQVLQYTNSKMIFVKIKFHVLKIYG